MLTNARILYHNAKIMPNIKSYSAHMLVRFSRVWIFVIPWTVVHQALLSMGFSKQEYWSDEASKTLESPIVDFVYKTRVYFPWQIEKHKSW